MSIGRPRSFDADKALDEAMEIFWRRGYDGATIAELTEAMGIKPPSLYAAFGNKEGLLKAALDRYTQKRDAAMQEVLALPTAKEVAERLLLMIADAQTDPDNPRGCLLVQGGLACGAGSENVPFELAARRQQTEDQLRARFVGAKRAGDLPVGCEPAALARFVATVLSGMGVLAAGGATRKQLRDVALLALKAFD